MYLFICNDVTHKFILYTTARTMYVLLSIACCVPSLIDPQHIFARRMNEKPYVNCNILPQSLLLKSMVVLSIESF